ncbi:DNA-protecting protein DprA [Streptomyces sp. NBC_00124]|uniref:DNA-processing protein DprA n=1 Tax=Streptomyces sp. NBC_00124 TaxID=2975662 RepID=UPI00225B6444|nr:DNA-processing protein DprA [Streptomyces sp. NBC_00124]MCX5357533.1 DNA-protecting protein DprA [Streptomyces sp. NBC_00124]
MAHRPRRPGAGLPAGPAGPRPRATAAADRHGRRRDRHRVPTERAVTRAHDFATALTEAGHTVTATLAYGLDSTAHRTAAEAGRASPAVLPHGLDSAHPHAHAPLLRSVLDGGGAAGRRSVSTGPAPQPAARR